MKTAFKDESKHHFPVGCFSIQKQDELVLGMNQVHVANKNHVVNEEGD